MESGNGLALHVNEVATRDGLQMESRFVETDDKVALVDELSALGYAKIEVTEDVVHMLDCMGYRTGMDLPGLLRAAAHLQRLIAHALPSQVSRAGHRLARHAPPPEFGAIRERALARGAG